jgi:hypothetical protein
VAVLIIAGIIAGNTWLSFGQHILTSAQANLFAELFHRQDRALYASDEVISTPLFDQYRPLAWYKLLGAFYGLSRHDPVNALRWLGAATLAVYLAGMYLLLYRQTHSTSISLIVTAISMSVLSLHRPYWGIGPLAAVTPETVLLAFVPWVVHAYLRWRRRRLALLAMLCAGSLANIQPFLAMDVVLVLLAAMVASWRRNCLTPWRLIAAIVAAAAGACPAIWQPGRLLLSQFPGPKLALADVQNALDLAGVNLLYPAVLAELLRWLPLAVLLAVPAGLIISRAGRYRVRDLDVWLWLLAAAGLVALGLSGLAQLQARVTGRPPIVIEWFEALRLPMLPLYMLLAQAMIHLIRIARQHRLWIRLALSLLVVAFLAGSYNTQPLRRMLEKAVAEVAEKPYLSPTLHQDEMRAVALWAGRHSAQDSLWVCEDPAIRLYGRRSLKTCPADVLYVYHLRPAELIRWGDELWMQKYVIDPPGGTAVEPERLVSLIYGPTDKRTLPQEVYAVIRAEAAPGQSPLLREIKDDSQQWGTHWRVYRILYPQGKETP